MTTTHWFLAPPTAQARTLARAWLAFGIVALLLSGVLAILLVLARTPIIGLLLPDIDLFHRALVTHVNLSVLVWFLAFAGVLWSWIAGERACGLGWLGLWMGVAGAGSMTLATFLPGAVPLQNNYIPVLLHPAFFAGLWAFLGGCTLTLLRVLLYARPLRLDAAQRTAALAIYAAAAVGAIAMAAFVYSWWWTSGTADARARFELAFWTGGHTLQFQHSLLAVLAWLWLAAGLGAPTRLSPRALQALLLAIAAPAALVPALYALAGGETPYAGVAELMRWGHLSMLPAMALALVLLWRTRQRGAEQWPLLTSVALFASGGLLAFGIHGANVVIPAHYHGSIVGVTLAFMGLSFLLLPQLGFGTPRGALARWQPLVYGAGQFLHIAGLAWSGGYGVQRKVAGAEQVLLSTQAKLGMGLMGFGGLIAIIGGLLFAVVALRCLAARAPAAS